MSTYERVADLPLTIDGYALEGLARTVSSGFERLTTVIRLHGGGEEGVGEDVTYEGALQLAQQEPARCCRSPASGRSTRFSAAPGRARPVPRRRARSARSYRDYRRWAFETAALDLALRQAGRSLAEAVGRELGR